MPACPVCNKEVQPEAAFCPSCGSHLQTSNSQTSTAGVLPQNDNSIKTDPTVQMSEEERLGHIVKRLEKVSYILAGTTVVLLAVILYLLL
ncbi:MAG: zinc ribbon domain-containing protein [Nitrososphaerota archaeon]|nr:zinc ribbon domain-containing protein [Nitrososphaerota archaeon]